MTVSKDELIGNHLIDQLVSSFVAARPILLRALQPREGREPGRLPVDAIQSSMGRTRQGNTEGNDGDGGEAWAKPDDGMQCPVCQGHFSQELIEDHVDRCLSHASTNKDPLPRPSLPVANHATKQPVTMHHMRRPVYNLLKDSEIKKLLRDLDLPTGGNRDVYYYELSRHLAFYLIRLLSPLSSSPGGTCR